MELGVLFTTKRSGTGRPFNPSLCNSTRCILTIEVISLHITTISDASFAKKILISLSISFSPFISTSGLGVLIPALAKRDPSPAAMIANFIIYQLFVDKDNENKVQNNPVYFFIDSY